MTRQLTGAALVLAVLSRKGGSGKTTVANMLGNYFALRGFRTLILEVEDNPRLWHILTSGGRRTVPPPDASQTSYALFTSPEMGLGHALYEVDVPMMITRVPSLNKPTLQDLVVRRGWVRPQKLDFLPGSEKLRLIENRYAFAQTSMAVNTFEPLTQLSKALERIRPFYDIIVMDTPPSLTLVQQNVVMAATHIIHVVDFDVDSVEDYYRADRFFLQCQSACRQLGRPLPTVLGVIYNRYDSTFVENDVRLLEAYTKPHFDPEQGDDIVEPLIRFPQLGVVVDGRRELVSAMNARQSVHTWAPTSKLGESMYLACYTTEVALGLAADAAS